MVARNLKDAFGMKERLIPLLRWQVIKKVDLITRGLRQIGILVLPRTKRSKQVDNVSGIGLCSPVL